MARQNIGRVLHSQQFRYEASRQDATTGVETGMATTMKSILKKKNIHFSSNVRVRKYAKEETSTSGWYTKQELDRIKQDISATVRLMKMNTRGIVGRRGSPQEIQFLLLQNDDDKYFCSRGLECRIRCLGEHRSQNKKLARDAVLDEQRLILLNNYHGSSPCGIVTGTILDQSAAERLSRVYKAYSFGCQVDAMRRGKIDEYVASRINSNPCDNFFDNPGQPDSVSSRRRHHSPTFGEIKNSQIKRRVVPRLDFK